MGCAEKRQKKKKPLFSLQELLCKDVESLATSKPEDKQQKKKKNAKNKKGNKDTKEEDEVDEFEAFIKQQLAAKKR